MSALSRLARCAYELEIASGMSAQDRERFQEISARIGLARTSFRVAYNEASRYFDLPKCRILRDYVQVDTLYVAAQQAQGEIEVIRNRLIQEAREQDGSSES